MSARRWWNLFPLECQLAVKAFQSNDKIMSTRDPSIPIMSFSIVMCLKLESNCPFTIKISLLPNLKYLQFHFFSGNEGVSHYSFETAVKVIVRIFFFCIKVQKWDKNPSDLECISPFWQIKYWNGRERKAKYPNKLTLINFVITVTYTSGKRKTIPFKNGITVIFCQ